MTMTYWRDEQKKSGDESKFLYTDNYKTTMRYFEGAASQLNG